MPVVCYYDTEARYRQRERGAMKLTATYVLIGINIVIFLLETSQGGSTNRDVAMKFGAQYTPYVRRGQWYRLITSMFLHFGFIHLLCNMYSLSNLGTALERFFGIPLFLVLPGRSSAFWGLIWSSLFCRVMEGSPSTGSCVSWRSMLFMLFQTGALMRWRIWEV